MSHALVIAIYALFLIVFGVASFLALYQLYHFGYVGDASLRMLLLYLLVAAVLILGTFLLYFILL